MSMTAQEKIQIIQDQEDGYPIQSRPRWSHECWNNLETDKTEFDFIDLEYRRKPEPVVRWVGFDAEGYVFVRSVRGDMPSSVLCVHRVELVEGEFDE
jgi:hypothetical protein